MIKKTLILSALTACINPSMADVTNLPLGGVYDSETQMFKLGDFETKAENMVIKGNSFGFDVAPENIPFDLRSSLGEDVNIKKGKVLFTSEDSRAKLTAALVADEGIALTEMTIKGSKNIEQTQSIDELIDEMSGFKSRSRIHYTSGSIIDKATSDIKKSGCELSEQGLSLSLELSHDRNTALLKPNATLDEVLKTFNGMTASWNLDAGGVANHSTAFSLKNEQLHITNSYKPVCTTFDPTLNTEAVNKVRSSLMALPAFAGQYPTLVSTISAIGGYAIKVLESPNISVQDDISIDVKKGVQEATLLSGNLLNGAISNLITANQPNNN